MTIFLEVANDLLRANLFAPGANKIYRGLKQKPTPGGSMSLKPAIDPRLKRTRLEAASVGLDDFFAENSNAQELWRHLSSELQRREIFFGDSILPSFPRPHLHSHADEEQSRAVVEHLNQVLERFGKQVLEDGSLRRTLGLSPTDDGLLEICPGFDRLVVISRLDMTLPGSEGAVFEVNTDSPAMMTFTDHLEDILLSSPLGDVIGLAPTRNRLTSALLISLLECYREWGGTRDDPTIAIVDWKGEMTASELRHTAAVFGELGCESLVCDPSELSIRDGAVHAQGHRIDIIQRRVLFPDFDRRSSELQTFLEAIRRNLVCVANPLRSITVGNKSTLAFLSQHQDLLDLSEADRDMLDRLLPKTVFVSPDTFETLDAEKDLWVIKGSFSSGGKAVVLGVTSSPEEWRAALKEALKEPTVAQRKRPIPTMSVPCRQDERSEHQTLWANYNPWVFGGRFAGGSTRVSQQKIVSITAGGGLLPALPI